MTPTAFARGDQVILRFGRSVLYGVVVAAGPKSITVEWHHNGHRNTIRRKDWKDLEVVDEDAS